MSLPLAWLALCAGACRLSHSWCLCPQGDTLCARSRRITACGRLRSLLAVTADLVSLFRGLSGVHVRRISPSAAMPAVLSAFESANFPTAVSAAVSVFVSVSSPAALPFTLSARPRSRWRGHFLLRLCPGCCPTAGGSISGLPPSFLRRESTTPWYHRVTRRCFRAFWSPACSLLPVARRAAGGGHPRHSSLPSPRVLGLPPSLSPADTFSPVARLTAGGRHPPLPARLPCGLSLRPSCGTAVATIACDNVRCPAASERWQRQRRAAPPRRPQRPRLPHLLHPVRHA